MIETHKIPKINTENRLEFQMEYINTINEYILLKHVNY